MSYNFTAFNTQVKTIETWLHNEFGNIRTGRASISFLDQVRVEAYGEMSPLANVASVGIEDAKTIKISPWDTSLIRAIEKGITAADLGVSTAVDSAGIRVIFPDLTGERRQQLAKLAKTKLEDAKVQLRQARAEVNDDMKDMTEDDIARTKKELEALMITATSSLDSIYAKKETEITTQ